MSEKLIGVRLEEDFVIESARVPLASATGSCQSTGYTARSSDERQAFVKVLDTTVDKDAPDPIADLKARVDAYYYERNLLEKTAARKMSRVVRAIASGELRGIGDGDTAILSLPAWVRRHSSADIYAPSTTGRSGWGAAIPTSFLT